MPLTCRFAALLAAGAPAVLAFAALATAQDGVREKPPLSAPATASPAEQITHFLGAVIPNANFIASASRMAVVYAQNSKLRAMAGNLAKEQAAVAHSLAAWVNVNGPVVTRQSHYAAGGSSTAKVTSPQLLPAQASELQQLSLLRGAAFDAVYLPRLKEAFGQLQTAYRDFGNTGKEEGLKAIAKRELPKVEQTISALNDM